MFAAVQGVLIASGAGLVLLGVLVLVIPKDEALLAEVA
jgi:hypothetical protein